MTQGHGKKQSKKGDKRYVTYKKIERTELDS